jgi:glycosyltransferase involved in cell wall biosynthesis
LGEFLDWVKDYTMFDDADLLGIQPLATREAATGKWHFRHREAQMVSIPTSSQARFVLDGVCWQNGPKSIQNFWTQFLLALVQKGMADQIVLLDRAGTAPRIKGVHTLTIRSYQSKYDAADSLILEKTCRSLNADLFVSTGNTIPTDTPSFRVNFGNSASEFANTETIWAANHASAHAVFSIFNGISMCKAIPEISSDNVVVLPLAVNEDYQPLPRAALDTIKQEAGLPETYVVLTGERDSEESADTSRAVVHALHLMQEADINISLICVGGKAQFEPDLRTLAPSLHVLRIDADHEAIPLVFAAAHAFVNTNSNCMGTPVLNAMACGTPILATPNTISAELAREVACFCDLTSSREIAEILVQLHDMNLRSKIAKLAIDQAALFTTQNQAEALLSCLNDCVEKIVSGAQARPGAGWRILRRYQTVSQ